MKTRLAASLFLAALLAGCGTKVNSPRNVKPNDVEANMNKQQKKEKIPAAGTIGDKDPLPDKKAEKLDVPPNIESREPGVKANDEPGVIRGRVHWTGPLPEPPQGDHFVTVNGRELLVDPSPGFVVDSETNGLADVMVWLESAPVGAKIPPGGEPALRQSRGVFRPRVQFAKRGDRLVLTTTEEIDLQGKGLRFARFLAPGKPSQVTLHRLGLVTIRSDDRPWMQPAYVRVLDHGFCTVTGKDGKFELPLVPPGEYDVLLWPAGYQRDGKNVRQRAKVTISKGRGATIDWVVSRLQ